MEHFNNESSKKTRVLICYLGGTIGEDHVHKGKGLEPVKGKLEKIVYDLVKDKDINFRFRVYEPDTIIDSSRVNIENWNFYTKLIWGNRDNYDAFLIFNGTDTMAYTASALSFSLGNINKPILITGSQDPAVALRNDAFSNMRTCFKLLNIMEKLPKTVCLLFGENLLIGNCSTKVSSMSYNGFGSINGQSLAKFGSEIQWNEPLLTNYKCKLPYEMSLYNKKYHVAVDWITPCWEESTYPNDMPKAVIFILYGAGNGPDDLLTTVIKYQTLHIPCIITSQCPNHYINMDIYEAGKRFKKAGAISCFNMTVESILTKALYLVSKDMSLSEFKHKWSISLNGEFSDKAKNLFSCFSI